MEAMGIDVGTTTVCGIVLDTETGKVVDVQTLANDSVVPGESYEWLQNPDRIWELVQQMYREFTARHEICSIGLTGQMHGVLYVDSEGNCVSPLYTWQDERGNQKMEDGRTYAEYLQEQTGCPMATGFGVTTHFYNGRHGLVPERAACICTIHSYIAMKLTGSTKPLLTSSDAAGLGCFDRENLVFDFAAMERAGADPSVIPEFSCGCVLAGKTPEGIPVSAAIGDNQAAVLGSVRDMKESLLVNVGTSNQISVYVDHYVKTREVEIRPLVDQTYIFSGAGLCGGRAYAALEHFFRQVVIAMTGADPGNLYGKMGALLDRRGAKQNTLTVDTRFCGTRVNPKRTGSIGHLTLDNFNPEEFTYGVLGGIVEELAAFYREIQEYGVQSPKYLIGSGNAVRMNPHLRAAFEKEFGMKLQIPVHKEEAAYGAALFAMTAAGICPSMEDAQQLIAYDVQTQ